MRYKDCPEDTPVEEQYIIDQCEDKYYWIDHGMEDITALLNEKEERINDLQNFLCIARDDEIKMENNSDNRYYTISATLRYPCIVDKKKQGDGNKYDGVLKMNEVVNQLNLSEFQNRTLKKEIEAMMELLELSGIQYHISDELKFCLD